MQEKDNTTEKTQGAKAPEDKSGAFISENKDFVPESRVFVPETGGTSPKKPRLLVTYIESGMGHIMSMRAVADALKRDYSDRFEIVETEIMRDTNSKEQIWFEKFLTAQTKLTNKVPIFGPTIFSVMEIGKQPMMRFLHHTLFRRATDATVRAFEICRPDIILSTHYFVSFAAIEYKRRCNPDAIIVTYNPDNNVHVWWDNRSDLFITNNAYAAKEAVYSRHFSENAVKQVFFTARSCVVNAEGDKNSYREKYGIDKNAFVVMFADGAYADGKGKRFAEYFMKKTEKRVTVLFLAGKNEKVYRSLCAMEKRLPENVKLRVFGFTPEAYELYAASDLFVTKGGPNAVLDALYMGTPVLIDYFPHPIEKATYKVFVEGMNLGWGAFDKKSVKGEIERLMDSPDELEDCRKRIAKNIDRKKNGADEIGEIILNAYENRKKSAAAAPEEKGNAK